jgi:hypothetical protein
MSDRNDDLDVAALLARPPHVDDAGFTDRVIEALPPRRRASRAVYGLVPAAAAVGVGVALVVSGTALASVPLLVAVATLVLASSLAAAEA